MVTTRFVLAVVAIPVLLGGVFAFHRNREILCYWLLAVGFGITTVWAGLSAAWAEGNDGLAPGTSYLALALMCVVTTMYFGKLAVREEFFGR